MSLIRRGDIYFTHFGEARDGEVAYSHPSIVVSNNIANANTDVLVVIPITSNTQRIFVHDILLPLERTGLNKDSKAQVNLIRHISTSRLAKRLGFVPDDLMLELDERIFEHLGLRYRPITFVS
jgi:mRNA interferase MazF